VLDFQRGGEAARNLNSFYTVTRAMVTDAGVTSSLDLLQGLVSMFARIRAAWGACGADGGSVGAYATPSCLHPSAGRAATEHFALGGQLFRGWKRRMEGLMYEAARQTLLSRQRFTSRDSWRRRVALFAANATSVSKSVRKIRGPVEEMGPIMAESTELLRMQPELEGQLELYKSQLGDLQTTLGQIRVMLLARQASLEAGRAQLIRRLAVDGRVSPDTLRTLICCQSHEISHSIYKRPDLRFFA